MTTKVLNELQMAQGWLASARVDAITAGASKEEVEKIERIEDQLHELTR